MNRPAALRPSWTHKRPRSYVFRNYKSPRLRNSRPWCNFNDAAHRPRTRARAYLPQAFAQASNSLFPSRLHERELLPRMLGELDRLETQLDDRSGELGKLRSEGCTQTRRLGSRITKRRHTTP